MKNIPVKKNSFVVPLQDLQPEDLPFVPKNFSLLSSVQSTLPSQVTLPSALVIKSSLFEDVFSAPEKKEKIKELVKKMNGVTPAAKKKLLHTLQHLVLRTPLRKEMEREILSSAKKLSGNFSHQNFKISAFVFADSFTFTSPFTKFVSLKKEADVLKMVKEALAFYFSSEVEFETEQTACQYSSLRITLVLEKAFSAQAHGTVATFHEQSHDEKVLEISSFLGKNGLKKKQKLADNFLIYKDALEKNKTALFSRTLGEKSYQGVLSKRGELERLLVSAKQRDLFSLSNEEVVLLSRLAATIEKQHGSCRLEWEKVNNKFFLHRIEPVHLAKAYPFQETYTLQAKGKVLAKGMGIGQKIAAGKIRFVEKARDVQALQYGNILVVTEEVLGVRSGIAMSSALIVSEEKKNAAFVQEARELSLPVVILSSSSLQSLKNGKRVTVANGIVYEGMLPFELKKEEAKKPLKTKTRIMLSVENPDNAFALRHTEADGVGIVRCESLFAHALPVHPLSLILYPGIKDKKAKKLIEQVTRGYTDKKECAVEKLAAAMAKIAIAFAPAPVTIRLSDFKSQEFSTFVGASEFKKVNSLHLFNPDANDEVTKNYRAAFALQCEALRRVRDDMGLTNIIAMVPFCPTPEQGEEVLRLMKECGLERGKNKLQIHGRCEIPANFILASEFIKIFDGLSLDTAGLHETLSEESSPKQMSRSDAAVKILLHDVINVAHKNNKSVSFASTALQDATAFSEFLIQEQIDSLSVCPDAIKELKFHTAELEKTVGRTGNRTHKGFLTLVVGMGAMAATLIGMGSGCNVQMSPQLEKVKEVGEYLPPAKIREELEKNFQKQIDKISAGKRISVGESGFAEFIFEYSSEWKMNHGRDTILLQGATSTEYVKFSVLDEPLFNENTTTTVVVVDGKQSLRADNFVLGNEVIPYRIEVPLQKNRTFVIEGGGEEFERVMQSVRFASGE